jgi:hydroxymethylpyrimidine pyrophosphatase-like HAD family hydrolase
LNNSRTTIQRLTRKGTQISLITAGALHDVSLFFPFLKL